MALILKKLCHGYFYLNYEIANPLTKDLFITSPLAFAGFVATYLYTVKVLGPKFMEYRQPYNIKNIIIVYNVLQILANVALVIDSVDAYLLSSNWICLEPELDLRMLRLAKYFGFLKLADCIETIFFVLRKSYRQISFLHVYHHSGMVFALWVGYKYNLGASMIYIGGINSFVHGVMFVYYLLSSIDPEWKKNLLIKKMLTQIQLIQFVIFVILYTYIMFTPNCSTMPKFAGYLWITQNFFIFSLFADFYIKTYWKKNNKKVN